MFERRQVEGQNWNDGQGEKALGTSEMWGEEQKGTPAVKKKKIGGKKRGTWKPGGGWNGDEKDHTITTKNES